MIVLEDGYPNQYILLESFTYGGDAWRLMQRPGSEQGSSRS